MSPFYRFPYPWASASGTLDMGDLYLWHIPIDLVVCSAWSEFYPAGVGSRHTIHWFRYSRSVFLSVNDILSVFLILYVSEYIFIVWNSDYETLTFTQYLWIASLWVPSSMTPLPQFHSLQNGGRGPRDFSVSSSFSRTFSSSISLIEGTKVCRNASSSESRL